MVFTFKKIKKLERFPKSSTFSVHIFLYHFPASCALILMTTSLANQKVFLLSENSLFLLFFGRVFSYLSSSSIHVIDDPVCFTFCLRVYLSPLSLYLHFCVILLCLGIAVTNYIFSRLKKKEKKGYIYLKNSK